MAKCPICGGTGDTKNIIGREMTEQEYLQTCNTEQLADFLADKCNEVVDFILHEVDEHGEDFDQDEYWFRQDAFVEWLKQPHNSPK